MTAGTETLRVLVACDVCKRQYDATGFATGSRFHCACGEMLTLPRLEPHDAAVVRCSSCGAPRSVDSAACGHCRADFTLHERDLTTLCSACMTRVSGRARFCHHCATPIVPQCRVGTPTRKPCPACGLRHRMHGRSMGDPPVSMLECRRCAGLWLGQEAFVLIADRTREQAQDGAAPTSAAVTPGPRAAAPAGGSVYRKCPVCRIHMNRRNFGRRSGIVIDSCKDHGVWFDAHELDGVLRWIRAGGEIRAGLREQEAARHTERQQRLGIERDERNGGFSPGGKRGAPASFESGPGLLESFVRSLLDF